MNLDGYLSIDSGNPLNVDDPYNVIVGGVNKLSFDNANGSKLSFDATDYISIINNGTQIVNNGIAKLTAVNVGTFLAYDANNIIGLTSDNATINTSGVERFTISPTESRFRFNANNSLSIQSNSANLMVGGVNREEHNATSSVFSFSSSSLINMSSGQMLASVSGINKFVLGGAISQFMFNGSNTINIGSLSYQVNLNSIRSSYMGGSITTFGIGAGASATGAGTTCFGYYAGNSLATGSSNTYLGYQAGRNSTGFDNTMTGFEAGYNTVNNSNTFAGYRCGYATTGSTCSRNTASGYASLRLISTGIGNTISGAESGLGITTGSYNVILGDNALYTNNVNNCVAIGAAANASSGITNAIALGYQASALVNNQCVIGNASLVEISPGGDNVCTLGTASKRFTNVYASSGLVSTSDIRLKTNVAPLALGLDFIDKLKPISYCYNEGGRVPHDAETEDVPPPKPLSMKILFGLSAQDVQSTLREMKVSDDNGLIDYSAEVDRYGLNYQLLIPCLIAAVKTLHEQVRALQEVP